MVKSAAAMCMVSEIDTVGEEARSGAAPIIDLVHLSRQTFGDHELERELLTLFERQAAQFATRLALPSASVGRAEIVHTLKGSARAIGAFGVAAAAESYEETLRQGESLGAAGARLDASIRQAREAIEELLRA